MLVAVDVFWNGAAKMAASIVPLSNDDNRLKRRNALEENVTRATLKRNRNHAMKRAKAK